MSRPRSLLGLGLAITLANCALASPDFSRDMDGFIERAMAAFEIVPGLGVCVVVGDDVLYLRGFGRRDVEAGLPVTADTGFYIASSTKSFTGMAAAVLVAAGHMELDAPITRYLPDLTLPEPLDPTAITLRACLTHRTGINNADVQLTLAFDRSLSKGEFLDMLRSHSSPMPSHFIYTNLGYNIVGYAIEETVGKSWKKVVTESVFEPVGMSNTTTSIEAAAEGNFAWPYEPDGEGFRRLPIKSDDLMHAAGGIVTTSADLSRWLIANLNEGKVDGRTALDPAAVALAHAKSASTDRDYYRFHRTGYGLGWYHADFEGDLLLHHFGGYQGYHAHVSFMPEHGIGVAVLLNGESHRSGVLADVVAGYAYESLLEHAGVEAEYAAEVERLAARTRADRVYESAIAEVQRLWGAGEHDAAADRVRAALPPATAAEVVDEADVNRLGYDFLEDGAFELAIAAFSFNAQEHPQSANAHDSLGEALERAGEFEEAKVCYEKACALVAADDRNLETFQEHLQRVVDRLAER